MIEKYYTSFKREAELFFVNRFVTSPTIDTTVKNCLDIVFGVSGMVDSVKGINLMAKYGQGKTFFFDVVNHGYYRKYGRNLFKVCTAEELAQIYTNSKSDNPEAELLDFITVRMLVIDDVGDEKKGGEKIFHNYKNSLNVIKYVLQERYKMWKKRSFRTFITTNLTTEEIADVYGGRVADRLKEMCHTIEYKFLGKGSFRQMEGIRKLTPQEVALNWLKVTPRPKAQEPINLTDYLNEIIEYDNEYFEAQDNTFWGFVRYCMEQIGFLEPEDYKVIDNKMLDSAELLFNRELRTSVRILYSNATREVRKAAMDRAFEENNKDKITEVAKNYFARKTFLGLRDVNYKF